MNKERNDESALSPEESLRLIEDQRAAATRRVEPNLIFYYLPWGVTWLVGFGLFFLKYGPAGRPIVPMPAIVPLAVLYLLIIVAIAFTIYESRRSLRGITGPSSTQMTMYGFAWPLAFAAVVAVGARFGQELPSAEIQLLWSALSLTVVGALYLAGGALWRDRAMYVVGGCITVANAVGVVLGPPGHALLFTITGAAMIIAGIATRRRG